ncbi:MAG TPA: relaxase domain-containing protein [Acidimicrobiales bacterium]|nr:relaxase domain-containing protein [Acidimicrobiales bacterium]
MLRLLTRRSNDVTYFTNDAAHELDGLRDAGPGWWLRGSGDTRSPADVSRVLVTSERAQIVGYDLVIAAPRPISVLLAVDPDHARGVVAAHRASVRTTMEYLEERALVVRDRRGGLERDQPATWERVVSFTHGLNRHGEPHLHDHVLVGARPESQRTVLDARALYAHAHAADALYRASLRFELAERTPWSAWRSFEGVERVVGLDEGYRALWAGHHRDRGEKLSWSRDETRDAWASDQSRFESLGVVSPPERSNVLDEHRFAGSFEGRDGVARRHVVEAWANAASFGQDPKELTRSVDDLYPALRGRGGVYESTIPVREARMIPSVREHGPRPLDRSQLGRWRERSLERDSSREVRSR